MSARIRVPASTSNLGAGFDCLGLALRRYLYARYAPGREPLEVRRLGTLAALDLKDADDLLVRAFRHALAERGAGEAGGVLEVESEIPVGRGLGSSGAAIVAGLGLAAGALGERVLDARALLPLAEPLEGHPDNVTAALFGGLVAIYRDERGAARAFRPTLSDYLGFAYAAPGAQISTREARAALPERVPHAAAVRSVARVAALLRGLASGEPEALRAGFGDELHVPHRLPLIPGGDAALAAALEAGAIAATISGSGSGLIAVAAPHVAGDVAQAMGEAFRREAGPDGVVAFAAQPDFRGAALIGEDESPWR